MTGPRLLAGRYRVERLLGTGGMAAVWRAHDERLDRPVAVKELTGDGLGHPRALERFEREARTIARLAHPNIVAVYDFGTENGDPYLVMELVDGRTVAELLADGPLPVPDALAVAVQACDGLAAAHRAGIVHRDVKPDNLLVTPSGVVKIFDFGIARFLDGAAHPALTASSVAMGSATYMAPEQINNAEVDARTDLYALGCSLYEMLSGAPPFAGTPLSVAHQQVTQPPRPLSEGRPHLPHDLDALVAELLAKDPWQRPRDATLVRRRLAALAAAQPHPTLVALPAPASPTGAALLGGGAPDGGAGTVGPPEPGPAAAPPAGPGGRAAAGRRVRRGLLLAAALLAAAGLVALGALLSPRDPGVPATAPAPAVPPATGQPSSPAPAASSRAPATRAATSRPPAPSPTPTDPIAAMRLSIQRQVDAGNMSGDTAHDLDHMVDDLAKAIATGNTGDEQKKLKALDDKLTNLYKEGKLSADGYRALERDLVRVATAVL